jgi:hypothetical protein
MVILVEAFVFQLHITLVETARRSFCTSSVNTEILSMRHPSDELLLKHFVGTFMMTFFVISPSWRTYTMDV